MLDKRCSRVLKTLEDEIGTKYKVVEKQALYTVANKHHSLNQSEFAEILQYLDEHELISIKYQDDEEICLAVTVKGQTATNEETIEDSTHKKNASNQLAVLFILVFLASFLGTLLAIFITK